jgi:hypothetical protein
VTVSIRTNIADGFWISATPVRFAGNVAVFLIGGLYFGILATVPLWRGSQEKHRIWSAVRRQNDIRA